MHLTQNRESLIRGRKLYETDILSIKQPLIRLSLVEERGPEQVRVEAQRDLARIEALGINVVGINRRHPKDAALVGDHAPCEDTAPALESYCVKILLIHCL